MGANAAVDSRTSDGLDSEHFEYERCRRMLALDNDLVVVVFCYQRPLRWIRVREPVEFLSVDRAPVLVVSGLVDLMHSDVISQ
jgi:hypothetical protein